jgi:hypothetical protein
MSGYYQSDSLKSAMAWEEEQKKAKDKEPK